MNLWQKIKSLFSGDKGGSADKGGASEISGVVANADKGKKQSAKSKRKDIGHVIVMFLLIFVALVMFSETTLAILNLFFWKNQNAGAFVIPIAIMPALAVAITIIIIYVNSENNKMAARFADAFDKVSHGEFGYQLEVPKSGQFKSLFENFNKMSKELKSIQTLKDEFIHDFSHEFKTPIASINGFANLLLDGGLSEEERTQYLKIIAHESARLSALSENTLMLSRLENQQFIGEVKPYRLDLQIKECVILLERAWSEKNISIDSELTRVQFSGNASLMQQVWLNILSNAIKFTPSGGEIAIRLSSANGNAEVRISDNGIGMSEEVASHIFDKYYQGDTSHSTAGNGLGLAIVKRIVTLSGGAVSVESKEGEGSTFIVSLPQSE